MLVKMAITRRQRRQQSEADHTGVTDTDRQRWSRMVTRTAVITRRTHDEVVM